MPKHRSDDLTRARHGRRRPRIPWYWKLALVVLAIWILGRFDHPSTAGPPPPPGTCVTTTVTDAGYAVQQPCP